MAIEGIIFDFGGVIMRTEDREPRRKLAERLGMTYEALDEYIFNSESAREAALGRISEEQHWYRMSEELDIPAEELVEAQKLFWGGDRVDEALMAFIRSLKADYKTELLSNAWSGLRPTLEMLGLTDAFHEIVISAEVGFLKPDPRIYQIAAERLSLAPAQTVFIDDFPDNVNGARAVGMYAIQFKSRQQTIAALKVLLEE